jgi:alpha-ketoglutarate-dependent taurine dioxygenase
MKSLNITALNILDLDAQSAELPNLGPIISEALETKGYIVLRNCKIDVDDIPIAHELILKTTELIGEPISHDAHNSIVWDIKSNSSVNNGVVTYSEHSHEAQLHTDSQYSLSPEEAFGLLTLKKAKCGGGESFLLSMENILAELRALPEGDRLERVLRENDYPFIVPNVFKKSSDELEFNFGPIISDGRIRFRVDTLEKALLARPDLCTIEQVEAYEILKDIILNSSATLSFFLEERDLIFINNLTMLHGRSQFTDSNRHLLRVRFNLK